MKLVNLVAIETGILVGLISWMVYSRFPAAEQLDRIEAAVKASTQVAPAGPMVDQRNQRPYGIDDGTYRDRAQPMAYQTMPNYYQPYYQPVYQPIVTQPYNGSAPSYAPATVDSSSYTADQEPATLPEEYAGYPPVVYYAQPIQTVIFSDSRPFRDRQGHRAFHRPGGFNGFPRQCPPRVGPPPNGNRALSQGNLGTRVLSQGNSGTRVLSQSNLGSPAVPQANLGTGVVGSGQGSGFRRSR